MNIFQDLKQKLEKGFVQAGSRSQRMIEVSRLSLRIKEKKKDLDKLVEQFGWTIYEAWDDSKQEISITDSIRASYNAVQNLDQEIKQLEEELNQLKSYNIETRANAETVKISSSSDSSPQTPMSAAGAVAGAGIGASAGTKTAPQVIYLCSFCAHQVDKNASQCPHCQQQYY